jgi:hypothetical protein
VSSYTPPPIYHQRRISVHHCQWEQYRLRAFEVTIFGQKEEEVKRWKKLHNEELNIL